MNPGKKFIIGNWKMNPENVAIAQTFWRKIEKGLTTSKKTIPVICPPFIFLDSLSKKKSKKLFLGSQDVFYESSGSHTGEISPAMLVSLGVRYCIIGHSERRARGETNELINKKLLACLNAGLTPIICVGEKTRDDDGCHLVEVREQVMKGLAGISRAQLDSVIIAYEPVFAVGAAKALDAHGVYEMILYIKKILIDAYKLKTVETAVLYGGAVDPNNAEELLTKGNADGFLIGRQSLDPESFLAIFNTARMAK